MKKTELSFAEESMLSECSASCAPPCLSPLTIFDTVPPINTGYPRTAEKAKRNRLNSFSQQNLEMFFSTSDFARPPPLLSPTSSPLIFDVPSPPISKDALQQSQDSSGSSEEEEEEEVDAPPWLLEGGAVKLVRRRKKSPNRGGLNDLAKFWAVQLGDSKREKERRNAKRTPTGEHTELEFGA